MLYTNLYTKFVLASDNSKMKEYNAMLAKVKAERLEERRVSRKEERRVKAIAAREERRQRERDEAARREREERIAREKKKWNRNRKWKKKDWLSLRPSPPSKTASMYKNFRLMLTEQLGYWRQLW
ncbi:EIF3A [Bugula neritina]|uniref:EIF3A n=1 Tax=Bugula neritina TaxID=10212 RepID=A0A7J7KHI5_BUGNE|nr:EIF3A [Bugula neritina]